MTPRRSPVVLVLWALWYEIVAYAAKRAAREYWNALRAPTKRTFTMPAATTADVSEAVAAAEDFSKAVKTAREDAPGSPTDDG